MKTTEQITQWLKDQRLYGKFYVNYNRYMPADGSSMTSLRKQLLKNSFPVRSFGTTHSKVMRIGTE